MGRRNESSEKKRRGALIGEFLKENPIKDGSDINDLVKELIAQVLENSLEGELDDELGYTKYDYKNKDTDNSRNGYSKKTVRSSYGDMEIEVPRDRKNEFEPQLIQKNQNTLSQDIESKIISMYAKGMSTGDIEDHVKDLYGIEMSDSTISRITDKVLPLVKEWQSRPLEEIYAVVFLDAIHYHDRRIQQANEKSD